MSSSPAHCPFLNRSDDRCSSAFSLDHLDHAFHYCFGRYKACPQYLELLVERRLRRQTGGGLHDAQSTAYIPLTIPSTVRNRIPQHATNNSIVPDLSGV